jgi:glutamate synthase (NADPH/NADH) small chain
VIVWAINEGRQCARVADRYLRSLPARDPRDDQSAGTSGRFRSPDPPQVAADA